MQRTAQFGWPKALRSGTLVVAAGVVGCSSPSAPPAVATVTVSPGAPSLIAGTTQQLSAVTADAKGNTLTNRQVTWSSGASSFASVSAAGLVTAVAPGTATITATSEGRTGTATVTVLPVPIASIRMTPSVVTIGTGATTQLAAEPLDANGAVLVGRTIAWASLATSVATVSGSGLVTGTGPGSTGITATSEGVTGTTTVTVQAAAAAPVVANVIPATMIPGATISIDGAGFGTGAGLSVTIGGKPAQVTSVQPNEIVAIVPCVASGSALVRVTVNGQSGQKSHPTGTAVRTLSVGQSFIATDAASSGCNELPATAGGARYLVAVFSNATSANSLTDLQLEGNPAGAAQAQQRVSGAPAARRPPVRDEDFVRDSIHFAFLERDRALYERLRAETPRAALTAQRASQAAPAVGDVRSIFFTYSGGCNDTTRVVRGRAIYSGTRTIVWEDTANTLQSSANSDLAGYYQRLGQIFDQEQYDAVRRHFADPLRRDAVTDADGRVHMVFTQRLNGTGAAAYVTSCDQFPTSSTTRGSNFGEFFYGTVPTVAGSSFTGTSAPDGWFYFMARTVIHEVKHIASVASRVANGAPAYEQGWLEEGTARHAEEVWIRESLHRVAWKANTGFGTAATGGIYCDFHPSDATCNAGDVLRRPSYGMRRQFNENREKLTEPWNWSPFGTGSDQTGSGFYQVSWSLVRYALDRYATTEPAFFGALTNALTNGVTNLAGVAGASLDRLLGGWGLALYADDYPGLTSPDADVQFPTWNTRDIYAGLNASPSWSSRWNTPFPVEPTPLAFGSFVASRPGLRGGAHALYEISGSMSGPQLLGVRALGGGEPASSLRVAIVRLP